MSRQKLEEVWKSSDLFRNRLRFIPQRFHETIKERWMEKVLFEQRKQLFNSYPNKKSSGSGTDWRMKKLIHKPPVDQPDLLTNEVKRLIAKRFQNIQEWRKERDKKNKVKCNSFIETAAEAV